MHDTLESPAVILQEKTPTAQDVLVEIQELVSQYNHARMSGYATYLKAIVKEMIDMVEWAGVQSEMMVTFPTPVSRETMLKRLEFTVELKGNSRNIGIAGMLIDSHYRYTTARFTNIRFGEVNGNDVELSTDQKRSLETFVTILNDEGVLEMAR